MNTIGFAKEYCTSEFGQVHFWSCGDGPALLLLHQASQNSAEHRGIAAELAADYRVIALDYPGHGASDDPDHELSVPEYGTAALAVLDHLGIDKAHVGGHHSGALLAVELGVNHAARVGKVIVSGLGKRTEESVRAIVDRPMSRDLPVDDDGHFLAHTWDVYRQLSSPGTTPNTTYEFFRVSLDSRTRPYDAHYAFIKWDRDPVLEKLNKPTLLMHGEYDSFAEDPESLLDVVPNSRFVSIPGGGAFLFHEKPAECAAAIRTFLAEDA